MSDDKQPKVFLAKPPKKVSEMSETERLEWAAQLSPRLKPDSAE